MDSLQREQPEVGAIPESQRMEWRRPGRKGFLDISRIWHMLAKMEG